MKLFEKENSIMKRGCIPVSLSGKADIQGSQRECLSNTGTQMGPEGWQQPQPLPQLGASDLQKIT